MFPTFQKFDLIAGKYWDREPRFAIVSVPERETLCSEKFSSRLDLQARSLQTIWNRRMRRMRSDKQDAVAIRDCFVHN